MAVLDVVNECSRESFKMPSLIRFNIDEILLQSDALDQMLLAKNICGLP